MGKHNTINSYAELSDMYPQLDTWETVNSQLNAFGTFDNSFTDKMGLSQQS
jgi:hypothetical protein